MAKYRQRPPEYEAVQWFKSGDHSGVVLYEPPYYMDHFVCRCGKHSEEHGWFGGVITGDMVCPGDWILDDGTGHLSVYPNKVFIRDWVLVKEDEDG